jgi:hypothetical protein
MQLHSTTNAQNTQLSAGPRFLRRMIPVAIAAGLFAIAGLSLSGKPAASAKQNSSQGSNGHPGCTLATLQGRYLVANSTMLLPPAFGVTTPTLASVAGFNIFNGDGTGTDTVTFTIGGVIVLENAAARTRYTVNADCTGKYEIENGPSHDVFIAPDGSEFAWIATAPAGNTGANINRRVANK